LLVAEIPLLIAHMIEKSEIDFATFTHIQPKNTGELVNHYEENLRKAENTLQSTSE
jgi:hypothetical protein